MTSQSRAIRSQSRKIVKLVKIMAQTFLNCESTSDLTDVPASRYDRKTAARPFDSIHDILRSISLAQSFLKGRNAPIWRIGNRGVKVKVVSNLGQRVMFDVLRKKILPKKSHVLMWLHFLNPAVPDRNN